MDTLPLVSGRPQLQPPELAERRAAPRIGRRRWFGDTGPARAAHRV